MQRPCAKGSTSFRALTTRQFLERIDGGRVALGILDIGDAMEFLANSTLHDYILLVLVVFGCRLEMQLVVVGVGYDHLSLLHVHADGEDALEGEVGVFDVTAINLLVLVEQVRVLELLNGLLGDLADPVVHPEPAVLEDHLLQIITRKNIYPCSGKKLAKV